MEFFRTGKWRVVYLLALAQLVGGPLVLLQVMLFCKLTVREAPRVGLVHAAVHAWNSDVLHGKPAPAADLSLAGRDETKPAPSGTDPKLKLDKAKSPVIPWEDTVRTSVNEGSFVKIAKQARIRIPAWPQAPPGPPPRVG